MRGPPRTLLDKDGDNSKNRPNRLVGRVNVWTMTELRNESSPAVAASTAEGERAASSGVPRFRFVVVAVLWFTAIFLYFDRVNISMAAPHIMAELGLSGAKMGLILGMFSWGFIFGHVSGGIAADRLNIRRWSSALFFVWCIATAATGFCRSVVQFVVVRVIFGFCEGAVANPMNKLQNHWVLPSERGWVNGSLMFAAYIGLVVGMPLVAWLIDQYGWRTMFFISGAVSVLGVAVFWLVVYDYPKDHPWISARERSAIETALAKDRVTYDSSSGEQKRLSFREAAGVLLQNRIFWAICGACFFVQLIYVTNFSWLPSYLTLERGFSSIKSGNMLAIPYLAAAVGALSGGFISDRIGSRTGVIITAAVLTMPAIGGLLLLDDERAVIAMLCLILFFNSAAISIFVVLLFDLFPPEIIGVALALSLGLSGGLGGVAGPLTMGFAYDLTQSFSWGFIVMAIGMLFSVALLCCVLPYERRIKREKRAASERAR
jgi:sugar phosphate permease